MLVRVRLVLDPEALEAFHLEVAYRLVGAYLDHLAVVASAKLKSVG